MKAGFKASSFLILVSLTPPLCLAPRTGEGIASDNMKTMAGGKVLSNTPFSSLAPHLFYVLLHKVGRGSIYNSYFGRGMSLLLRLVFY